MVLSFQLPLRIERFCWSFASHSILKTSKVLRAFVVLFDSPLLTVLIRALQSASRTGARSRPCWQTSRAVSKTSRTTVVPTPRQPVCVGAGPTSRCCGRRPAQAQPQGADRHDQAPHGARARPGRAEQKVATLTSFCTGPWKHSSHHPPPHLPRPAYLVLTLSLPRPRAPRAARQANGAASSGPSPCEIWK